MIILKAFIYLSKETEDSALNFVPKTNCDVLRELQAYLYQIIEKCLSRDKLLFFFYTREMGTLISRNAFPRYRILT